MLKTSVQNKILKELPDDRPITAITIVENLDKCPRGFYPIGRTYDQDQDANLKECSILWIGASRYLCLSKTEGIPNFVLQELLIVGEKTNPPQGCSLLFRTADTEQKPWKKKQICYRLVNRKNITTAVTDIIVCSRLKKAPNGFLFAGELNGMTICYKMGNVQGNESNGNIPPERPPRNSLTSPNNPPAYPNLGGDSDHDYEILMPPGGPTRPAPPRPPPSHPQFQHQTSTLGGTAHSLDGVPFVLNPRFAANAQSDKPQYPVVRSRTMAQILKEYDYPFAVERNLI